jgi:tRNA pseudouridine55 synthase
MARQRKGDAVHGWVIVDKPLGMTSTSVVNVVRRLFNAQKAGHGGTLDPLASGVLPIALGEATKTVNYALHGDKAYQFTVRWGEATTTDDAEGEIIETHDSRPSKAEILAILPRFVGTIEQIPPRYSAIKINGERAYDLARQGEQVEMKSRVVEILDLSLKSIPDVDHAVFDVRCGAGTYMRSLARDLAVALGTVGHIVELRRVAAGPFVENESIPLDFLREAAINSTLEQHLLDTTVALDGIPALSLTEQEAQRLKQGQVLRFLSRQDQHRLVGISTDQAVFVASFQGVPVAIVCQDGPDIKPVRVLNL